MSEIYTYNDLLEELKNRQIPLYHELVKKLSGIPREYVNPEQVEHFYGKNLYKKEEKQLYFFLENKVVEVKIHERNIKFRVLKKEIVEVEFLYPIYEDSHASMKLTFGNGEVVQFDSNEDTIYDWKSTYVETIKEIYKSLS